MHAIFGRIYDFSLCEHPRLPQLETGTLRNGLELSLQCLLTQEPKAKHQVPVFHFDPPRIDHLRFLEGDITSGWKQ